MKILLFSFLIYAIPFSYAYESIDCKLQKKASENFLNCESKIYGYVSPDQTINEVELKYKNSQGEQSTLTVDDKNSLSDFNSKEKIEGLLKEHGIKDFSQPFISVINISKETPLYKDPERLLLKTGCHLTHAPVVISSMDKNCSDFICLGSVECRTAGKQLLKDVVCKAEVQKNGVQCPSANKCMKDKFVKIEPYSEANSTNSTDLNNNGTQGISK